MMDIKHPPNEMWEQLCVISDGSVLDSQKSGCPQTHVIGSELIQAAKQHPVLLKWGPRCSPA